MVDGERRYRGRLAVVSASVAVLVALAWVKVGAEEDPLPDIAEPPTVSKYDRWLESVDLLVSEAERTVFKGLRQNYQRDHFIEQFWKVRDPFPRTPRNEFRERWEERVALAYEKFGGLKGDRSRMLLTFGEPTQRQPMSCSDLLQTLDVWEYSDGSDRISGYFTLVFIGYRASGYAPHPLWQPGAGLREIVIPGTVAMATDGQIAQTIAQSCSRGSDIVSSLAASLDLARVESKTSLLPQSNDEWVRTFRARTTELDSDAELFNAELRLSFPGRNQSRTVVQGLVEIPKAEAVQSELGGHSAYNLLIDGEVLRQDELFDQFRYRFDFPVEQQLGERLPLVVQRYLRPGSYHLILKVEDLNSKRAYREALDLEVPRFEARQTAPQIAPSVVATGEPSDRWLSRAFENRLGEANASISTGDHVVEILTLPDLLSVGKLRVMAQAQGEGIARVAFLLNHRPVMRKSRPPYSVELNLGDKPMVHHLRVEALDAADRVLASDETLINAGPHRFAVRLLEPQRGKIYRQSVRAHAEVEVPEGEQLERLELYLNETLLSTLYQPPFEQPILLGDDSELAFVRAVAYLESGLSSEDVTFINAPDFIDEVDIHFVELFTTVLDRKGDFVEGLSQEDFVVLEDDVAQEIRRFETVRDLPIHAGIVLDTSLSMIEELRQVEKAAYRFLETVLTSKDRAAVITFNDQPQLAVRFTNDKAILAGGLASLTAEGETALYDSIIFALHYFSGLKGKRAIVLLTDGEDSMSRYTYEDAIDYARRTGVALYIVGLKLSSGAREVRMLMQRLAQETGGGYFSVDNAAQLTRVYEAIQTELRAQYLIAYQSSKPSHGENHFRRIEIEMSQKGLKAKTQRGYFP